MRLHVTILNMGSVTLDSRDPLGNASKSMAAKKGSRNHKDLVTIEGLKSVGELPCDLDVFHGNDHSVHGLWIADVIAYAIGRCIADHDPHRLTRLAPRLEMEEARVLPVTERMVSGISISPRTNLTCILAMYMKEARAIHDDRK